MSTLLLVHAHPDDESIATGGVMAKAHDEGHRVVLVTATRGEVGEIAVLDEVTTRPRLGEVREAELRKACEILGVDRLEILGYRDSGMKGTADNDDPRSFHRAPLLEAATHLAVILREEKPDVVVTYGPEGSYGHPDHIKAHEVTVAALDLMEAEGWRPAKAYFNTLPQSAIERWRQMAREAGRGDEADFDDMIGTPDEDVTTHVDVSRWTQRKREAFGAHVTQSGVLPEIVTKQNQIFDTAFGTEWYVLARGALGEPRPEHDLFVGV
jgi:N-acetyl-1-D-myo-inositol-2-amino-2-deoxy-alpha-D-glucopyranoside deacetylase